MADIKWSQAKIISEITKCARIPILDTVCINNDGECYDEDLVNYTIYAYDLLSKIDESGLQELINNLKKQVDTNTTSITNINTQLPQITINKDNITIINKKIEEIEKQSKTLNAVLVSDIVRSFDTAVKPNCETTHLVPSYCLLLDLYNKYKDLEYTVGEHTSLITNLTNTITILSSLVEQNTTNITTLNKLVIDRTNTELGEYVAKNFVFNTETERTNYIKNYSDILKPGDNLVVIDTNVPDLYWDGTKAVNFEVDLSSYPTITYLQNNYYNKTYIDEKFKLVGDVNMIEILWEDLKALRDSGALLPGAFYKITDYECFTLTPNTKSAGHRFDIIILALSKNTLSETALVDEHQWTAEEYTIYTQTEREYFSNSKLNSWQIKYCIDNDSERFDWAYTKVLDVYNGPNRELYKEYGTSDNYYEWIQIDSDNVLVEGDIRLYTTTNTPISTSKFYKKIDGEYLEVSTITLIELKQGKGVIYYMKDEFGNECPYDFKNILYTNFYFVFEEKNPEKTEDSYDPYTWIHLGDPYVYTFNSDIIHTSTPSFETNDLSLNASNNVYNNVIKEWVSSKKLMSLPKNIFFGAKHFNNFLNLDCYSNTFRRNCYNINFSNCCYSNRFAEESHNISFDCYCHDNVMMGCEECITFGKNCNNNHLGAESSNIIFNNFVTFVFLGLMDYYYSTRYSFSNIFIHSNVNYIRTNLSRDTNNIVIYSDINGSSTTLKLIDFSNIASTTTLIEVKPENKQELIVS